MKKFVVIFSCIALLLGFFPSSYTMKTSLSVHKELAGDSFKEQLVIELLPKKMVPLHGPLEEYTIIIKKDVLTVGKLVLTYAPDSYEGCIEKLKVNATCRKNGLGTNPHAKSSCYAARIALQKSMAHCKP